MDRTQAPDFQSVTQVNFPTVTQHTLDNGMPVVFIEAGSQDVVKLELVFGAGKAWEQTPLAAYCTARQLNAGTSELTSSELAERLDFYGAFVQADNDMDHSSVSLYSLCKHLPNTLPLLAQMVKDPIFPESELETLLQNSKQEHEVNCEKVLYLAGARMRNLVFGDQHPYGHELGVADYDNVQRDTLVAFYKRHYTPQNCRIVVSGRIPADFLTAINTALGQADWGHQEILQCPEFTGSTAQPGVYRLEKPGAVQHAIRIGRPLVNQLHPDFVPLQVVNTVLGGYFGSRLMSNIREDKGYTYGIGSAAASYLHGGQFFVSTQVGAEVSEDALREIYREMDRMCTELIGKEELSLVVNYLMGTLLKSMDGPFAQADRWKRTWVYGQDFSYYQRLVDTLQTITPEEIRGLANTYLQRETMLELVVG